MAIHPTAIISKEAELDSSVEVGPLCIIKGRTRIGAGTCLESHVVLGSEFGIVEIGKHNRIHAGAVLGGVPQDKKYKSEPTRLEIGDHNVIREGVTLNIGTVGGGGHTRVGSHNLLMAYVHLGHDCEMGNHNVFANSVNLAGHVIVENHVTLGGVTGVNQFVRIGDFAFVGGCSAIAKDILPYTIAQGNHAVIRATNKIGLERAGFTPEAVEEVNRAVRIVTKGSSTIQEALNRIEADCKDLKEIRYMTDFIKKSKRGLAL